MQICLYANAAPKQKAQQQTNRDHDVPLVVPILDSLNANPGLLDANLPVRFDFPNPDGIPIQEEMRRDELG